MDASFSSNEKFIPFFTYQSDGATKLPLTGYEIQLKQIDKQTYRLYDTKHRQFYGKVFQLQSCMKNNFGDEFSIGSNLDFIEEKSTKNKLLFNENNKLVLSTFVKDICAIVSLGQTFVKGNYPTLITFYLSSLSEMKQLLSNEDI